MSEPWAAHLGLSEGLQAVTERLAAARTQADILRRVLDAAQHAVGALGGAVLLVHDDRLQRVLTQGDAAGAHSLWRDGARADASPVNDALNAGQPLFFEHAGALNAAYPELEARSGGVAAVATAVLPLMLDDQALGVLVLDFREPHPFTPEERRFLRTLTVQAALALDRVALLDRLDQRVQARTATLDAFVTYSEAVGSETDVSHLAQRAVDTLRVHFGDTSGGYYARVGDSWKLRTWTDDLNDRPEFLKALQAGLPSATPFITELLETRAPTFTEDWDAAHEGIEDSDMYGTVAAYPVIAGGEVQGFIVLGLKGQARWADRDRAIFRAVGRGLDLALERTHAARRLLDQNRELALRARALEAFAQLTRDLTLDRDPLALVGRAQDILVSMLPDSVSTYYELQGSWWRLRSHRGAFQNLALLAGLQRGLPRGHTVNVDAAFDTRRPYYQDQHDPASVAAVHREITVIRTSAALPVIVNERVSGVLAVGIHEERPWTAVERTLLETIMTNLGLILERAEGVAQLQERTLALEQANEELEAFNYSVSHDLMTPVRHITSFAQLAQQAQGDAAKTDRYLGIIEQASGRMRELIDAMLELSRLGRRELQLGPVDLEALVRQAQADLETDLAGRDVTWRIAALPAVLGDRDTLQQVMTNLLSNAVKYTSQRARAVIEVWVQDDAHVWRVFVRDNGVGFDPRYTDKLFGIFQRLHRAQDFAGVGVGLANVRRIVARHGGTVFAHSVLGEGATFGFTLPKHPTNPEAADG